MNELSPTTRPEGCLSDFAFDRRLAGELDPREEAEARAHVEECARCASRWEELSREREAFAAEPLPSGLRARAHARISKGRLFATAGALAAAAAIVLAVRALPSDGARTKGDDVKLSFYVKHGSSVRLGASGDAVAPGDALRFVYTARTAQHLAVLSVDGARRVSVYYPNGSTAARAPAGADVALPESTVLDDTLGDETLYGVFCPEPFALEPLRTALEASPDRAPLPEGCAVEVLTMRKEAIRSP